MLSTSCRKHPSPCCVAGLENEQSISDFLATAPPATAKGFTPGVAPVVASGYDFALLKEASDVAARHSRSICIPCLGAGQFLLQVSSR
jgi:hypothetical protein